MNLIRALSILSIAVLAQSASAWTLRNPVPTALNLNEVEWTGSALVAFGVGGLVATSPDGIAWKAHVSGIEKDLTGLVKTGSGYLAMIADSGNGGGGRVLESDNGTAWSVIAKGPAANRAFTGLAWSGTRLVLATEGGLWTSTNQVTWEPVEDSAKDPYGSVFWTGTRFVAFGPKGSAVSEDGKAWTKRPNPALEGWKIMGWDGKAFLALTDIGDSVATSEDGDKWLVTITGIGKPLTAVHSLGGRYLGVGKDGAHAALYVSTDAKTWKAAAVPKAYPIHDIAWTGARYVAVGQWGTILTSPDGSAWTLVPRGFSNSLQAAAWSGSRFVAMGPAYIPSDTCNIFTSADARTWVPARCGDSTEIAAAAWTGSKFVGLGRDGSVSSSPDGIAWQTARNVLKGNYNGMVWAKDRLVAVGMNAGSASVATSTDGIDWTEKAAPFDGSLNAVAWSGTKLMAVGGHPYGGSSGGVILASADGDAWNKVDSVGPTLHAVTWTGVEFAAGGGTLTHGTLKVSQDGAVWSTWESEDLVAPIEGVAKTGKHWTIVGGKHALAVAEEGKPWTKVVVPGTTDLNGILVAGNDLVAFGQEGAIYTFDDTPVVSVMGRIGIRAQASARFEGKVLRVAFPQPAGTGTRVQLETLTGTVLGSWPVHPGSVSFAWDGSSLPSGIYFLRTFGRESMRATRVIRLRP